MEHVLGIDLGTTNSCFALSDSREVRVLENSEGRRTTPSAVLWDDERLVGEAALRVAALDPGRVLLSSKRLWGRRLDDFLDQDKLPYALSQAEDGSIRIDVFGELVAPEEVASEILKKIIADAQRVSPGVSQAVLTLPAHFDDLQRQSLLAAAELAGLSVVRLLHEPTAAALAYGCAEEERLLVFDLGGGTYDISLLESGDDLFEVHATSGDPWLGGDNFDLRIASFLREEFYNKTGQPVSSSPETDARILQASKTAKHELSLVPETLVSLPFLQEDLGLETTLRRSDFMRMSADLVERLRQPLEEVLSAGEPTQLLLVGGMSRVPFIRDMVEELVGLEARIDIQPDEAVAYGAAVYAGTTTSGEGSLLLDVTPLTLGIETEDRVMKPLIDKNTTIPAKAEHVFTTSQDNQSSVDINILQGESPLAEENKFLGQLQLLQIPPAIAGLPEIEVVFELDVDGVLEVSARDLATGESQSLRIGNSAALSPEEIARILAQSRERANEDEQERLRRQRRARINRVRRWIRRAMKTAPARGRQRLSGALNQIQTAQTTEERERAIAYAESLFDLPQNPEELNPEEPKPEPGKPSLRETLGGIGEIKHESPSDILDDILGPEE